MKIVFREGIEYLSRRCPAPTPSKFSIPDWYRSIPKSKDLVINYNNLKFCMPFLDTLSSGYTQSTWADIIVKDEFDQLMIGSNAELEILNRRSLPSLQVSDDYVDAEFIWKRYWIPVLPKGYSVLITHPHNRLDLPFTTVSGIVDADNFTHLQIGNIPFYLKKGFTGVIPTGTPMFQIFPFKREDWEMEIENYDQDLQDLSNGVLDSLGKHVYRDNFWAKKGYK
jgi:hypothetical protein